jgi:hypothetical protein
VRTFLICTVANDHEQYAAMKRAFLGAGFTEDRCCYAVFMNGPENAHDPYTAYAPHLHRTGYEYVVLCHQDVRPDVGDGHDDLLRVLRELDGRDPAWAIAGNAGVTDTLERVGHITDPYGTDVRRGCLPERVASLDENFLVINPGSGVSFSRGLRGFHLYALDLCLSAAECGHTCYVADWHLRHLSAGNAWSADFIACWHDFRDRWSERIGFRYVATPASLLFFSRSRFLRTVFGSWRVCVWLQYHPRVARPVFWLQRWLRAGHPRPRA